MSVNAQQNAIKASSVLVEGTATVRTTDGDMRIFFAHPAATGPHPVVLLFMDAVGFREELCCMARDIAAHGYYCLLLDLYYRWGGPSFDPVNPPQDLTRFMPLAEQLDRRRILLDTIAALDFLAGTDAAAKSGRGCIGFCMGGRFALWAAGAFPEYFVATASIFGTRLATDHPESPHLWADRMRGELYLGFASDDPHVPQAHINGIQAVLTTAEVVHTVEMHPGTQHGFAFPKRFCFNRDATERVWRAVYALFERRLEKAPRNS